jgi:hypothetical protein
VALKDAGLSECAVCHRNHRIDAAGASLLDSVCVNCHEEGSAQHEIAITMRTLFTTASEEIDQAHLSVERAAAVPLHVEDYQARLEEARTALLQSLPVMHALEVPRVESLTRQARSLAAEVESEVNGKLVGRRWRRIGLLLFWFYLILTVAVLLRFRRRAIAETSR